MIVKIKKIINKIRRGIKRGKWDYLVIDIIVGM